MVCVPLAANFSPVAIVTPAKTQENAVSVRNAFADILMLVESTVAPLGNALVVSPKSLRIVVYPGANELELTTE
ncbi:hypothetical protein FACS1894184_16580 [Clostridia bacterium]|nr:hypothetical protein FACS1894184_16580 [Clostridia bacterium]